MISGSDARESAMQLNAHSVLLPEPASVPASFIESIAEFDVSEPKTRGNRLGLSEQSRRDEQVNVAVRAALTLVVEPAGDRGALQQDALDANVVQR